MNAHQLGAGGVILNTIVVESLDVFPNLIAASVGGSAGDTWTGTAMVQKPTPPFDREAAATEIDAAVMAVYDKPVSLSREYTKRLKGATDYKAAGYAGVVPPRIAAFATAAGLTATAATDRVIAQAAQFDSAEDALGDLRMRKYEVQLAGTETTARAVHADVMAQIATVAAQLV